MNRSSQLYWRLGWLMVGLLGLVTLTLMPQPPRKANPAQTPASPVAPEGAPTLALDSTPTPGDWVEVLWSSQVDGIENLLAGGGDANAVLDGVGSRPLHALFAGPGCQLRVRPTAIAVLESLEALLKAGADINASDHRGNSPLILAASRCDARVVERLLLAGADPEHRNQRDLTALEMTLSSSNDAAQALLSAGVRLTSEQVADYRRIYHDEPAVLALIEQASPDRRD